MKHFFSFLFILSMISVTYSQYKFNHYNVYKRIELEVWSRYDYELSKTEKFLSYTYNVQTWDEDDDIYVPYPNRQITYSLQPNTKIEYTGNFDPVSCLDTTQVVYPGTKFFEGSPQNNANSKNYISAIKQDNSALLVETLLSVYLIEGSKLSDDEAVVSLTVDNGNNDLTGNKPIVTAPTEKTVTTGDNSEVINIYPDPVVDAVRTSHYLPAGIISITVRNKNGIIAYASHQFTIENKLSIDLSGLPA